MSIWNALQALWRHDRAPSGDLDALSRRVAALEAGQADCLEVVQLEADRAARWADMSQQLRRFLGRLDAHAGQQRRRDEAEADTNGHARTDPKQLAAILRSKYPNAGA